MPAQAAFNSGDFALGGAVSPFEFSAGAAALTCCASGDVDYSDSAGPPPTYGYAPAAGFDQNVRYIRINPKGSLQPGEAFEVRFRARIE